MLLTLPVSLYLLTVIGAIGIVIVAVLVTIILLIAILEG